MLTNLILLATFFAKRNQDDKYRLICEEIINDRISFEKEAIKSQPKAIEARQIAGKSILVLIRSVLGLFNCTSKKSLERKYFFQGLRNSAYFDAFSFSQICILTEGTNTVYSNRHGLTRISDYPELRTISMLAVVSAVKAYQYWGLRFFLEFQLYKWDTLFCNHKRTFFIYEDSQPLGIFISSLSRLKNKYICVICIQHGFLWGLSMKPTGAFTLNNMVWNNQQGKIIQESNPLSKCIPIGLDYVASANLREKKPKIYLLGSGLYNYNLDKFNKILYFYSMIIPIISNYIEAPIYYRPHPNEIINNIIDICLKSLKAKCMVDKTDKKILLTSHRSIFIGSDTSLLYEAQIANHFSVNVLVKESRSFRFKCDYTLAIDEISSINNEVKTMINNFNLNLLSKSESYHKPIEVFLSALEKF
ncbi:hypothetical protein [Prochlorococcus marinus]|uniref:hypothetical protein n=1 Tax=Prochlorococcus marinus TaxID=1219 RepID=UPI0022B3F71C|nr:hypothetical protein [Prochlorococcus marinus]